MAVTEFSGPAIVGRVGHDIGVTCPAAMPLASRSSADTFFALPGESGPDTPVGNARVAAWGGTFCRSRHMPVG